MATTKDWSFDTDFDIQESKRHAASIAKPDELHGSDRFWGKFQGTVEANFDPEQRLRLLVNVPEVWGHNFSSWALPCLPYAGLSLGMYVVPPLKAHVWVEFENGNPDFPIWTGFFYDTKLEVPITASTATPGAPLFAIESLLKHAVVISDAPLLPYLPLGGILLKCGASYIAIEPSGIRIVGVPAVAFNQTVIGDPFSAALFVT